MSKVFDLKVFLQTVTNQPGVYRVYDMSGLVIYVGKAKNLKKRLANYLIKDTISHKTKQLIKNIAQIDVTITHTETEALLLEHNYIKRYQPRYNVLLRDDRSYPYIFLSAEKHPRLAIHRKITRVKGDYFGPFPSICILKKTLILLQKLFLVRQCDNNIYQNRSRPCLQYQIKRCLGPCVKGLVSDDEYNQQVEYVRLFLLGKNQQVIDKLVKNIEMDSQALRFESAARYRDQILAVRAVTEQQFVFSSSNTVDLDAISIAYYLGIACVQILFIRQGKVVGSRSYYPKIPANSNLYEVVQIFLGQFYLHGNKIHSLPREILLDFLLPEKELFSNLLTKITGHKINIQIQPRGIKGEYLKLAHTNAMELLTAKIAQLFTFKQKIESLANLLRLKKIYRIECFDISHISGQQTVASCVVFNNNGPLRSEYRRYNINNITPGDDYAAMHQVLTRRYNKHIDKSKVPDVIVIDGGKGQLAQAFSVFQELKVNWDITQPKLIGVAKGHNRKAGLETLFFRSDGEGLLLSSDSPALHLIQNIRDESHNHAIIGHRRCRAKIRNTSTLESIKGIGPKRRQLLLKYMGGLQAIHNASINDFLKVPMISFALAKRIFNTLKQ